MLQRFGIATAIVALVGGFSSSAQAQGPIVTAPTANQVFKTGPDYATDVLQDPWDFSNFEDLSPSPDEFGGWTTSPANKWTIDGPGPTFITGGKFQGTANGDNQLVMLYKGDAIGLNPGRTGMLFPINTTLYRKLAMKITYTGAAGPPYFQPAVYWGHAAYAATNYLNRGGGALFSIIPNGTTTDVYSLDLATAGQTGTGSQLIPACGGAGCTGVPAAWNAEANVLGFRIDPTTQFSSVGVTIDWVRLTAADDAATAAMMDVTYQSCTGSATISVRDANNDTKVVVSGAGTSSARFNYGIFPPGSYTLIVACNGGSTETPFTINDPPHVTVVDPDEKGDPDTDYAFTVSSGANRWDFEESTPSDIASLANVSTTAGACASGGCGIIASDAPGALPGSKMFRASSVGTTPSTLGDPALDFLGGTINPVPSSRNRFLTFSLRLNRPYDVATGSVMRSLWGSRTFTDQTTMTHSQDMRVWPGFQKYTIDLGALTVENGGIETDCLALSPPCPTTPWPTRSIRFFRIDPHEFGDTATSFDIDDVSLTAPDEVNLNGSGPGSSFTIKWTVGDTDSTGASYATRIFIDTDRDPTSKTEITSSAIVTTIGSNQFTWTPPVSTPPGSYYVYVQTSETRSGVTEIEGAYSTGPIVVYSSTATSPSVSVISPTTGQQVTFPFTITGCAFDQGNTTGINMDDLAVFATAGTGVTGVTAGTTYSLGYGSGLGALEYGPLTPSTPVVCPTITNTASPFRNSGFRVVDVGLPAGPWTLRVLGRSTISGRLTPIASDVAITSSLLVLPAVNFQLSGNGINVTISFQAPSGGPPIGGYVIDVANNPGFSPVAANVTVPAAGTYSGALGAGTWYFRVVTISVSGSRGGVTETKQITLPTGGPTPPGAPTLTATQVTSNPIVLSWSAGSGGVPTNYTLFAGTSPGGSDLGTFPMGTATTISAAAPLGMRIYVRVRAENSGGSAVSNEINFQLAGPSAPSAPTLNAPSLSGRNVTLTWSAGTGGSAPTSYTVLARFSATGGVAVSLPVTGTTLTVAAPPGTYFVSIVANNGGLSSPESNQITLVVP